MAGKSGRSGRPKGSGAGLDAQLTVRFTPATLRAVEEQAAQMDTAPGAVIREIVDRWARKVQRARKLPAGAS